MRDEERGVPRLAAWRCVDGSLPYDAQQQLMYDDFQSFDYFHE